MKKRVLFSLVLSVAFTLVACSNEEASSKKDDINEIETETTDVADSDNGQGEDSVHQHEYVGEVVTPSDCFNSGKMLYTCSCGDQYSEIISNDDHVKEIYEDIKPTCIDVGRIVTICSCGEVYEEYFDATGHELVESVVTEATCAQNGLLVTACSTCGYETQDIIAATGHNFGEYVYNNDASYEADGTETALCLVCGEKATRTVPGTKKEDGFDATSRNMRTRVATNLYADPSEGAAVTETLPKQAKVWANGQSGDKQWYRVEYEGITGYVKMDHLITRDYEIDQTFLYGYYVREDFYGASAEEIKNYTFTDMNVTLYAGGTKSFWNRPFTDEERFANVGYQVGWAQLMCPMKITGKCNECDFYRAEMNGVTVYVDSLDSYVGDKAFYDTIPEASKGDPGLEMGTKEWHDYWDGTTMLEYYLITGQIPSLTVYLEDGVQWNYHGQYPLTYVIGSYATISSGYGQAQGQY